MSLPPSTAPTTTGWSDSCRAGFAPAEEWRLCTAHCNIRASLRLVRSRRGAYGANLPNHDDASHGGKPAKREGRSVGAQAGAPGRVRGTGSFAGDASRWHTRLVPRAGEGRMASGAGRRNVFRPRKDGTPCEGGTSHEAPAREARGARRSRRRLSSDLDNHTLASPRVNRVGGLVGDLAGAVAYSPQLELLCPATARNLGASS